MGEKEEKGCVKNSALSPRKSSLDYRYSPITFNVAAQKQLNCHSELGMAVNRATDVAKVPVRAVSNSSSKPVKSAENVVVPKTKIKVEVRDYSAVAGSTF